jgi:hypothetical protein
MSFREIDTEVRDISIVKIEEFGFIRRLPRPYCLCIASCDIFGFFSRERSGILAVRRILEGSSIGTFENVLTI